MSLLITGCGLNKSSNDTSTDVNVLLISIDTVRADHLSCYGYDRSTSPNLDALAKRGVLYERAYSQAPWTLVSHMSVFTSLLPSYHKVESINQRLSIDIPLMAEMLKEEGWETAAFVNNGQMKQHWGFGRGFDLWREFEALTPDGRTADEGRAKNITDHAVSWLEKRTKSGGTGKFFMFLHYFDAHDPYDPPAPFDGMFKPKDDIPMLGEETGMIVQRYRMKGAGLPDPRIVPKLISLYDGEIRYNDYHLGRLFAKLDELDIQKNTLVVVFSDHGEEFKEHGSFLHGGTLYREVLHVPLIISCPGRVPEGARSPQPARLIDILPTILHVCELQPYQNAQGVSLLPIEYDATRFGEIDIRSETKALLEGTVLKSIRTGPLTYIYSPLDGSEELYDRSEDPDEQRDVSADSPVTGEFRGEMERWMNRTEAYWTITLTPDSKDKAITGRLETSEGLFGVVVPSGFDLFGNDNISFSEELDRVGFSVSLSKGSKTFYFETTPDDAVVSFELVVDGDRLSTDSIGIGDDLRRPKGIPFGLDLSTEAQPPFRSLSNDIQLDALPTITVSGFRSPDKISGLEDPDNQRRPDAKLLRELKQLGYMQ